MNSTYTTRSFTIGRDQAQSAQITIKNSFQNLTIRPAENPNTLIEGTLDLVGEMMLEASGDTHKVVSVREEQPHGSFNFSQPLHWDIALAPGVPLSLIIGVNSGEAELHLAALTLRQLRLSMNSGESYTVLPATSDEFDGHFNINSGDTYIQSAGSLMGHFNLHNNSGDVTFSTGAEPSFDLKLHNNSGDLILHMPEGATIQVDAHHVNSGSIIAPAGFEHTHRHTMHGGVWQSANTSRFDIRVNAFINSGNIIIAHMQPTRV